MGNKPKILFIAEWYPANIQRWLAHGFVQAGCDVRLAGPVVMNHYKLNNEYDLPDVFLPLNKKDTINLPDIIDKSTQCGFAPDILLFHDWWDSPIEKTETRIPFVLIEHEGWDWHFKRIHEFLPTIAYTGQPYGVFDEPRVTIYPGFEWLPGACDPFAHPFLNLKRTYDFCFLGALSYDQRLFLCDSIKNAGFSIHYGQEDIYNYAQYHNKSICTMECSGGQQYVKWRIFEAMSMGCVVISNQFTLLNKLFVPGEHYIPCKTGTEKDGRISLDVKDLLKNIKMLKNHKGFSDIVATRAFSEVRKNHTYYHRAKKILHRLGITSLPYMCSD